MTETISQKLSTIAENVPKVYDAGVEAGKKAEYDAFWDSAQDYGKRKSYDFGFGGRTWNDDTFEPKYDIIPEGYAGNMFRSCGVTDLYAKTIGRGIKLDFSQATSITDMFAYASVTRVPTIDVSSVTSSLPFYNVFLYSVKLVTIDGIVVDENKVFSTSCFQNCTALVNLTINGTIGQNGFDVKWSTKLSHDSIVSIINALSTTTTGLTVTLSITAVNKAFETSEGANDGSTSTEWLALVATKSNWTISLA